MEQKETHVFEEMMRAFSLYHSSLSKPCGLFE